MGSGAFEQQLTQLAWPLCPACCRLKLAHDRCCHPRDSGAACVLLALTKQSSTVHCCNANKDGLLVADLPHLMPSTSRAPSLHSSSVPAYSHQASQQAPPQANGLLQAVYTALKETEQRATDLLPLWKVPALAPLIPRQRKALQAVKLIRQTTEQLIAKCKEMVDAEEQVGPSSTPLWRFSEASSPLQPSWPCRTSRPPA